MISELKSNMTNWLRDQKKWKRIIVPFFVLAAIFVVTRNIDLGSYLQDVQKWILEFGTWGPIAYILLYVVAMLLFLPGTPFTILAAFLFGSLWGFVTMVAATTLSAAVGFLIARYAAKETLLRRMPNEDFVAYLTGLVEQNHRIAIPFIRLMPVFPFSVNNYALGLTRISFWSYILFSELVFIPMNAVLVLGANAFYGILVGGEVSWWLMGLTAAAGLLVLGLGFAGKKVFGKARPAGLKAS